MDCDVLTRYHALLAITMATVIMAENQKVLLISLDGFRWNFGEKAKTPNLDWIVKNGVSANHMINVFPTVTWPNHLSIVTGLYPEHHGILGNKMYNNETGEIFDASTDEKWWNQSVPIWIENQRQGHDSGVIYWPGYNVKFKGQLPKYKPPVLKKYEDPFTSPSENKIMPINERIDLAVSSLKQVNCTFVAFYVENPDETAHTVGADDWDEKSKWNLNRSISAVDRIIGRILKKLKKDDLIENTNVIVVGDHGHTTLSFKKVVYLSDFVNVEECSQFINGVTNVFIYAKAKCVDLLFKRFSNSNAHFKVYLRKDIPERLHIKHNKRSPDLLLLAEPGWTILKSKNAKEWFQKSTKQWRVGEHGFSTDIKDMHPIFVAFGPGLKKGLRKSEVQMVDLYALMCKLIGINARKNDGKFNRVKGLLKDH